MSRLLLHGMRLLSRGFCSLGSNRISVCIVGSGPAGFYTAEKMLKAYQGVEVDIIDRLPTPFGLVRYGVAPDHPETKIVANQFSRVAKSVRCSFFGNIALGIDISLPELRQNYDIVVLCYGAESDRSLGIPGEELNGIYSAREFVWWYNGHPDCFDLAPDLKITDTAVILGLGNVALDVARILLRPISELAKTDISEQALASLQDSTIRKVYLVARRGPAQAACTAKELREILGMKNLHIKIQQADVDISPSDEEELKNHRIQKRVYELISKAAASPHSHSPTEQRELHFVFFRKPDSFLPSENGCTVGAVRLERTSLKENGTFGKRLAVGTGEFEDITCGLVLKSIGYKSLPIDGLPFDFHKGVVPNVKGRVLKGYQTEHDQAVEHGLYVAGWLKRGPIGIIATNLYCAEETVASISEDVEKGLLDGDSGAPKPGRKGLLQLLENKSIAFVPFSGWEKIDAKEKMVGQQRNKPREKITTWEELLKASN
ncbi:NADPH:adrenodoxin oxidoreductase, mitochondrial [Phalaenopsis equestris]|uniref:NADPH:adrenodoxin oxidoreductase, mitochondrial n=1 Tax=Phalaenopsis equestris TaxID=78828 RepID=UPI0009E1AE4D|nr:NADPH:adrenodoxin oxidoreductase, mitochondrial [Phalaenopsis equestris]